MPFAGAAAAFLSSLTWAIGSTTYSKLSEKYPPYAVNFARALVSLPLFFVTWIAIAGGWQALVNDAGLLTWSAVGWLSLSTLCSHALGDTVFLWSTRSMGVPAALAIASSFPLLSALMGWGFNGTALSAVSWVGLVMIVGGTVLVILYGAHHKTAIVKRDERAGRMPLLDRYAAGVALAFATMLFWSLNPLAISKTAEVTRASTMAVSTVRMALACVMVPAIAVMLRGRKNTAQGLSHVQSARGLMLRRGDFKAVLAVLIFEGFGGSAFFLYGLMHSSLAVGAALTSLAPVISVPLVFVVRGERPSLVRTLGVCAVVAGICLLVAGRAVQS